MVQECEQSKDEGSLLLGRMTTRASRHTVVRNQIDRFNKNIAFHHHVPDTMRFKLEHSQHDVERDTRMNSSKRGTCPHRYGPQRCFLFETLENATTYKGAMLIHPHVASSGLYRKHELVCEWCDAAGPASANISLILR